METNKKSPFTGGVVELLTEEATTTFRNERYSYTRYYYRCVDTGRTYTDNELDDKSLDQVYDQYRNRHGIPSKSEIKKIRELYGLSALAMSKILGLGDNQYRLYEDGAMPAVSVGKLINLAKQKMNMLTLLELSKESISKSDYNRYLKAIQDASVPVVLMLSSVFYNSKPCVEQQSGEFILKKIVNHPIYKNDDYAKAADF